MDLYIIRVRLSWAKAVWREIAIRGDHTLADLHRAIMDAFEWSSDDEDYHFYVASEVDDTAPNFGTTAATPHPTTVALSSLELDEDSEMISLYAAGERNIFRMRVMSVEDSEPGAIYPDVVDELGESPDQELAYR